MILGVDDSIKMIIAILGILVVFFLKVCDDF